MDQQKLKLFVEKLLAVDAKSLNEQQLAEHMSMVARAKAMMQEAPKPAVNFSIEDLKRLEQIRDLPTMKAQALGLISRPSAKPMKPEKVEWFKNALEAMNSPMKVIKLMYDLLLSGEGNSVIGTRNSMNPNSYRQRFGEQGVAEGIDESFSPDELLILNRYLDDEISWHELKRGYSDLVGKAIKRFDVGSMSGVPMEFQLYDRLGQARDEGDLGEQGVAEAGNIGSQIKAVYQQIYNQGDDAIEFAYNDSPIFAQYWDEYEGDLDSIIAEIDPKELQIILDELEAAAEDQGITEVSLGDYQRKAGMGKALAQMGAAFAPSAEQRAKELAIAKRREAGLARAKVRTDKIRTAADAKHRADALARDREALPQMKAELEKLQAKFDPNYDYSDDYSFWKTQSELKGQINSLKQRIIRAETNEGIAEMDSQGYTGSRDDYKLGDPEGTGTPVKSADFAKQAGSVLNHEMERQHNPVTGAITRRILLQRTDLLAKYGPEKVGQAIDEVADFVGDVDEIGSSDVSGWVRHVEQLLGNMGESVHLEAFKRLKNVFDFKDFKG